MKLSSGLKFFLDILLLPVFLLSYKWFGIYVATAVLISSSMLLLAFYYIVERRIAFATLLTVIIVTVFGGLTLYLHDETFIKRKPTFLYLAFAAILLIGCAFKKGLLKWVMNMAFSLTERGWWLLSLRFGFFFLCLAALNEYVWRNYSTDMWVNFKVYGLMGLTMAFAVAQVGFLQKHQHIE